jgi:1-acyl-sn-glycerol-3-phosphate acyltransferase
MSDRQFALLRQRRFLPFFLTQAFGAFNDNFYKNVLVILVTYDAAAYSSIDAAQLTQLASGLFILPFVLFSGLAGQLADRFDKTLVMRAVKCCEVAIMTLATWGFATHGIAALLGALFLMGMHSTFFAPAKYGILPTILDARELVGGNAMLEMGTFVAVLCGQCLAGPVAASGTLLIIGPTLIVFAAIGLGASLFIPRLQPATPGLRIDWNLWRSTFDNLRVAHRDRTVFLAILGISWFWFYGVVVLAQMPIYSSAILHGPEVTVTVLLLGFSAGVGTGSLLCERLSGGRLEIGLVPLGSVLMTVFGIDLYFATPEVSEAATRSLASLLSEHTLWRIMADLTLLGLSAGFYIVPLYAMVQRRTALDVMSRVIAANSIWNAVFMVTAAVMSAALVSRGLSIRGLLLLCAALNFGVTAFIYVKVPEFLLRFLAWALMRCVYRVQVSGLERMPSKGAALVVCNHVSYADALVLSAAITRPMRFVMEASIFRIPVLKLISTGMKAIPVASASEDRAVREAAFAAVSAALREGHVVCIFPEGHRTYDGEVDPFRPGLLRILAENPVPVIPMGLSGLWGSMFSRGGTGWSRFLPRRWRSRVHLRIGAAVPAADATPELLRQRVVELRGDVR